MSRLRMQHESQPSDRLRLRQLQLHRMFSVSQKLLLLILFKKIQNFFRHLIHIALPAVYPRHSHLSMPLVSLYTPAFRIQNRPYFLFSHPVPANF